MEIVGSREVDDLSDEKQATLCARLNKYDKESDGDGTSDVAELLEQGNQGKLPKKSLGKCVSCPSSVSPPEDYDDIEAALRRIFFEDSVQSPYSRSISLPTPLKLVSALKGSREKQGSSPKKLNVTWAPDVYDPPPTSVLHTVKSTKKQKSKKNNDKKKNGKKGQKGKNSRGSGGSKDNKQFRRGSGTSDGCYKPLEVENRIVSAAGDLDDFKVGSPDPYCGSSFLKKSPTRMHYSVAEAL